MTRIARILALVAVIGSPVVARADGGDAALTAPSGVLNLPHRAAPAKPVDGDIWTSTSGIFAHIAGQSYAIATQANVLAYGADISGARDSATAFASAIAAAGPGGTVVIPAGTFLLSANPQSGWPGSITFAISPGARFIGAGAAGLSGFNHALTNGFNTNGGQWQVWNDLPEPQGHANTTNGWAQELLGPASGARSQVVGYMAADTNGNTTGGNVQAVLNLVQNVHKADLIGQSVYKPFEIDLDVDVSAPGAALANHGNGITGLLLTGGGAGGPYQGSGMLGLVLQRGTGAWGKGIVVQNAQSGLVLNTSGIPIDIQTTYYGAPDDPTCPGRSHPEGCPVGAGIVFSNAPGFAGTLLAGGQLANGNDTLLLRRASDAAPAGNFLRFRNAANSADLMSVNAEGEVSTARIRMTGTRFAALPVCDEAGLGMIALVTDSARPIAAWHQQVVAGGGENRALVSCNGRGWFAFSY
jgi:hypothetical protein